MKRMFTLCLFLSLSLVGCGGPEPPQYETPPELTVTCAGQSVPTLRGTFSWHCTLADGSGRSIEADSLHPLECKDYMERTATSSPTASLTFAAPPDSLQVQCWSEDPAQWILRCPTPGVDPMYAAVPQELPVTGGVLALMPGAHIYEVTAHWELEDSRGWGGSSSYCFWVECV